MSENNKDTIKFIDFCAGIGGGRLGLENNGFQCLGFSEIDKNAEKTYRLFFGKDEENFGDLMTINPDNLPEFDLMIAGFPCQSFSVIGQRRGIEDSRGQVIFGLTKIMKAKNLKYFILENVKGLVNHDNGKSLQTILQELDNAGYAVSWRVLNSVNHGVPQMRERIYFVGIRKDLIKKVSKFHFPNSVKTPDLSEYLIEDREILFNEKVQTYKTFMRYMDNKYNEGRFTLEKLLEEDYLVIDTRQSDMRLYRGKVPTLRTGRHGILYTKDGKFRKLSGYESLLLQGFPQYLAEKVKDEIADIYLLSQAGNAMTVNTIEAIAGNLRKAIDPKKSYAGSDVWEVKTPVMVGQI